MPPPTACLPFLKQGKLHPASGPSHLLFPVPGSAFRAPSHQSDPCLDIATAHGPSLSAPWNAALSPNPGISFPCVAEGLAPYVPRFINRFFLFECQLPEGRAATSWSLLCPWGLLGAVCGTRMLCSHTDCTEHEKVRLCAPGQYRSVPSPQP